MKSSHTCVRRFLQCIPFLHLVCLPFYCLCSSSAQLTDDLQRMVDAGEITASQAASLMPRAEVAVQPQLDAGAAAPLPSACAYAAATPDPRTQVECGICMNCPAKVCTALLPMIYAHILKMCGIRTK